MLFNSLKQSCDSDAGGHKRVRGEVKTPQSMLFRQRRSWTEAGATSGSDRGSELSAATSHWCALPVFASVRGAAKLSLPLFLLLCHGSLLLPVSSTPTVLGPEGLTLVGCREVSNVVTPPGHRLLQPSRMRLIRSVLLPKLSRPLQSSVFCKDHIMNLGACARA